MDTVLVTVSVRVVGRMVGGTLRQWLATSGGNLLCTCHSCRNLLLSQPTDQHSLELLLSLLCINECSKHQGGGLPILFDLDSVLKCLDLFEILHDTQSHAWYHALRQDGVMTSHTGDYKTNWIPTSVSISSRNCSPYRIRTGGQEKFPSVSLSQRIDKMVLFSRQNYSRIIATFNMQVHN